ncbi:helix-turn-helix transcriptional regulator [Cognaticolwellia beringensis]|jgi:prophage regulatory protein|uniref:AlpA family phage regulatory protein n=1 Tax=Cognaticolwellia beringensis TaxID=1967665 RepID=A0A222GC45_9GAMM|nr:AlpA family transcriptional regulator [Cognaticolwellia beringensis]ASP49446.1 AlpA family phage regulatory protein [Cognaticolwellia beringensis]
MTSTRLLRIKQVQQLTSLSKSYIYQLCNQNQFPKSIPLVKGGTAVAWVESEIFAFIESRIKARDEGEV